jgi:hypothetical protein
MEGGLRFGGHTKGGKAMKAEPILAKLNELRHEAEDDKTDMEYLALHHAFCFISYKMSEFQKYLDEVAKQK